MGLAAVGARRRCGLFMRDPSRSVFMGDRGGDKRGTCQPQLHVTSRLLGSVEAFNPGRRSDIQNKI